MSLVVIPPPSRVNEREVVELYLDILAGETIYVHPDDVRYLTGYPEGQIRFLCKGWELTFLCDAGSIDYMERAVSPDGRVGLDKEFDHSPEGWLSPDELDVLDAKLLAAATTEAEGAP